MLLVIDDPVSSFDAEVKLGMLSFLADRVPEVLKDNDESRVMLLTYDSKTFLALQELLGKLSFENPQSREKKTVKAAGWRLIDGEIKALKDADPVETEYKALLHAYEIEEVPARREVKLRC